MQFDPSVFGTVGKERPQTAANDDTYAELYPTLISLLVYQGLVDGKSRQTGTLMLVAEDGLWKMGLKDRDRNVSVWVSGATIQEAYAAMEKALTERPVAWKRPSQDWQQKVSQARKT